METLQLGVKERGHLGKSDARKLRRDGFIPAVLYGGKSNHSLAINSKELIKILENVAGRNAILDLKFEGKGKTHWRAYWCKREGRYIRPPDERDKGILSAFQYSK